MKAKTIKSVLRRKTDAWLASIENEEVRKELAEQMLVTGGSITSMLLNEDVNDIDIYFKTGKAAAIAAHYYIEQFQKNPPIRFKGSQEAIQSIHVTLVDPAGGHSDWVIGTDVPEDHRVAIMIKSVGIAGESGSDNYQFFEMHPDESSDEFVQEVMADAQEAVADEQPDEGDENPKKKFRPVFMSGNAITLSDRIQLVNRFYGSVDKIHENYDYVHCTCSWDAATGVLNLPIDALLCILNKELKYKSSKYPLCSLFRMRKFMKRGWNITAGQIVKIAWEVHKLDLSNPVVLEDQLIGVDTAYFADVLCRLREKCPDKIDGAYLMKVIDEIF